jgi:hypothetical protein
MTRSWCPGQFGWMENTADRGILRVIAFADPQKDIAIEQTPFAVWHQS